MAQGTVERFSDGRGEDLYGHRASVAGSGYERFGKGAATAREVAGNVSVS